MPLSKWDIAPVINGISRVDPLIIGVISHLLSEMSHQVAIHVFFQVASVMIVPQSFPGLNNTLCSINLANKNMWFGGSYAGGYIPQNHQFFFGNFHEKKNNHPACPIFSPWILSGKLTSLWKITMFNVFFHYKWPCSIAMLGNGWVAGGCGDDDIINGLAGSFPKVPCV
jgi:hypothetical protein